MISVYMVEVDYLISQSRRGRYVPRELARIVVDSLQVSFEDIYGMKLIYNIEVFYVLIGTCSLHEHNEIHVLEYREDSNQIDIAALYGLPDDRMLWSIESSSSSPDLIITCDQMKDQGRYQVNIRKMVSQYALNPILKSQQ